jgi:hypothetical protein
MGQTNFDEQHRNQLAIALISNWIQFALLLVALVTFALHGESRLSKIEQRMDDGDTERGQMRAQLERIEQAIYRQIP